MSLCFLCKQAASCSFIPTSSFQVPATMPLDFTVPHHPRHDHTRASQCCKGTSVWLSCNQKSVQSTFFFLVYTPLFPRLTALLKLAVERCKIYLNLRKIIFTEDIFLVIVSKKSMKTTLFKPANVNVSKPLDMVKFKTSFIKNVKLDFKLLNYKLKWGTWGWLEVKTRIYLKLWSEYFGEKPQNYANIVTVQLHLIGITL